MYLLYSIIRLGLFIWLINYFFDWLQNVKCFTTFLYNNTIKYFIEMIDDIIHPHQFFFVYNFFHKKSYIIQYQFLSPNLIYIIQKA